MKKLYFLINSLSSGGGEKFLSELVNNLCEEYDITLFLLEKNDFYNVSNKVKKVYLTNFSGKEFGIKKLILLPFIAFKLKKYIRKYNIKLIQSHLYRANYVNVLSKLMGANHKVQIVNHGIISKYFDIGLLGKINLFLIKNLYKRANLIIWISNVMREDANKVFEFENNQIVIHNVFDLGKVFVISSYHEGFATTLLEAHARGLPAIVTKSSGFCGEFVEGYGEKTGIVFIPQDIEKKGFLQEIENLINNYLIYEKKSINKAKIFSQDKVLGPIRNVL